MAFISTEEVAEIRKELKRTFPNVKFSVTNPHLSAIDVAIMASNIEVDFDVRPNGFCDHYSKVKRL